MRWWCADDALIIADYALTFIDHFMEEKLMLRLTTTKTLNIDQSYLNPVHIGAVEIYSILVFFDAVSMTTLIDSISSLV